MIKALSSILWGGPGSGEDVQERPQLSHFHGGHAAGGEQQDQKGVLRASGCCGQPLPGLRQAHHHPLLWPLPAQPQRGKWQQQVRAPVL